MMRPYFLKLLSLALILSLLGCVSHNGYQNRSSEYQYRLTEQEDALNSAIQSGDTQKVSELLSQGVNVSSTNRNAYLFLHSAIWVENKEILNLLISHGADVNAKDPYGVNHLDSALMRGNREIFELLIKNGADPNLSKNVWGYREVVELLIAKGVDVNVRDKNNATPLHRAVGGSSEVVELLIANGAEINARDNRGSTPLHAAAVAGNRKVVEILLANGADKSARNMDGATPYYLASVNWNQDLKGILRVKAPMVDRRHEGAGNHDPLSQEWSDEGGINLGMGYWATSGAPMGSAFGYLGEMRYRFKSNMLIEVGFNLSDKSTSDTCYDILVGSTCPHESQSSSALHAAWVVEFPSNDGTKLLLKLGYASISMNYSYDHTPCSLWVFCGPQITETGSASATNPMFGFGWVGGRSPFRYSVQYENFGSVSMPTSANRTFDIGLSVFSVGLNIDF